MRNVETNSQKNWTRKILTNRPAHVSGALKIKALENKEKKSRIAVIVGKKAEKGAVGRNRTRRQIREILREKIRKNEKKWDIAVMVGKIEKKDKKKEIKKFLNEALKRPPFCLVDIN